MYASEQIHAPALSKMKPRAVLSDGQCLLSKRKTSMNAYQVHGTIKTIAGIVQEQAGHLVGSKRQVLRGLQRQVLGAAQKRVGDCQEAARRTIGQSRGFHL